MLARKKGQNYDDEHDNWTDGTGIQRRTAGGEGDGAQGAHRARELWFAQMREIGSRAAEPRPEQIWMPGTSREVEI